MYKGMKIAGAGIVLLALSVGVQAGPKVAGSVPEISQGSGAEKCGRTHQTGVSDCTHDRPRSKQSNTAFFMAIWGEDGTPEDHAALESGRARYHDGDRTRMWVTEPANAADLAAIAKADAEFCSALAKSGSGGPARPGAAHNRESSMAQHIQDRSVYFASTHRKRRSQRRNTHCWSD
jgi:hypothetical protein